jgi:hypothetical protein
MPGQIRACSIRPVQREVSLANNYYPLILRAVQGLDPDAPGESRRALYERARAALIAQLRSVEPSLTETEVRNERLALEEAIRRVERQAPGRTEEQLPAYNEPPSDPLAELARLIAQTDPFGATSRSTVSRDNSAEEYPNSVNPLHLHSSPETNGSLTSPPAWLQRARMANVVTAPSGTWPEIGPDPRLKTHDRPLAPPIEVIPEQDLTAAIAFRPSHLGPLELLPDPPKDPHDPEQSQLYLRIRQQLEKLQADIPNQERTQIDDAVSDFLAQPASWQQVEFKKVLWLCGNALRNILAQHDAVKDDPEPHYSKLPPAVAEAMRRPVEAWNVFVLGDPDLVNLDTKRLGPQDDGDRIVGSAAASRAGFSIRTPEGRLLQC